MAEIDAGVIETAKKFFPDMAVGFSDPRVTVNICDGIKFVQEAAEGSYDVIIVDSSDPVGPAEVLFQQVSSSSKLQQRMAAVTSSISLTKLVNRKCLQLASRVMGVVAYALRGVSVYSCGFLIACLSVQSDCYQLGSLFAAGVCDCCACSRSLRPCTVLFGLEESSAPRQNLSGCIWTSSSRWQLCAARCDVIH